MTSHHTLVTLGPSSTLLLSDKRPPDCAVVWGSKCPASRCATASNSSHLSPHALPCSKGALKRRRACVRIQSCWRGRIDRRYCASLRLLRLRALARLPASVSVLGLFGGARVAAHALPLLLATCTGLRCLDLRGYVDSLLVCCILWLHSTRYIRLGHTVHYSYSM